jgi:iron(III) transport system substrate-binding protein
LGLSSVALLAAVLVGAACAPSAPPPAPTTAAATAPTTVPATAPTPATAAVGPKPTAATATNAALQTLIEAARSETTLKAAWSPSSFGGSAGFERLVQGMNRKYGLNIKAQFTPGIDEQAMAGRLAQEAAAGQPATEDVYLGNPAGIHDVMETNVFKSVDWRALIERPLTTEGDFDPVAPNGVGVAFASSVVGVTYNSNLVRGADVPHRLDDLLAAKWKGKIASTPYASGWREFVAADLLGEDPTFAFVRKFAPQVGGLIRCGESDRVTSGEFLMLVMDCGANDVITLKRQGAPIDHVVLDDAAVVHNRYAAVPVNSAAPNAAALFVAYLETAEAQTLLWEVDGLDFYLFPESNTRHAADQLRATGGKLALDSPQWLTALPDFNGTQKKLGDILQKGG